MTSVSVSNFKSCRFLSALIHFVSCLHQMEDIVTLIKVRDSSLYFTVFPFGLFIQIVL